MHFCSPAITEFNNVHQLEKSIISAAHHPKHPHETKGLWSRFSTRAHLSLKSGAEREMQGADTSYWEFWQHMAEAERERFQLYLFWVEGAELHLQQDPIKIN